MNKRFIELARVVRKAVAEEDIFGLKPRTHTLQMTTPGKEAFIFRRDAEKIEEFMKWLKIQVDRGILELTTFQQVGSSIEAAWTNLYIADSYKRGVMRARSELDKAGFDVPTIDQSGGIGSVMMVPFHADRLGVLFTRVFSDLKGITSAMESQIARVLAQGIADGDGMLLLARKLVATINGTGMGELGITDSLGRFIPASRRAEMLARTEIIRSHHISMIMEYRNWGLEGIKVLGEWSATHDERTCSKCLALDGKIFTLDEIEPMIPYHPSCFIDPQIPIYTSEGWKPIGKIEVGDFVLTHKRRFKKVYALPITHRQADVVTLTFNGAKQKTSITTNHQILVTDKDNKEERWIEAGKLQIGDYVKYLGNECARCKKSIPYFLKYCSHSCLSKDVTDKQWVDPNHRKNMSEKTSAQLYREYENGVRDKKKIALAAQVQMKKLAEEGNHPFQRADVQAKMIIATHTPELNKMHSDRMKANNPMKDPLVVMKTQESIRLFLEKNPEYRINTRMAKKVHSGEMFTSEKRMVELLDALGVNYVYQYKILRYKVDFAIPSLKIVIECDGSYWHKDKVKDEIRQSAIEKEGWFFLRYSDDKINGCIEEVSLELTRVLCNHYGEYEFIAYPIVDIKRWILGRRGKLYNLSVEEDESYIAKGMAVHNCRCIALPYVEELQKYRN